MANSADRVSTPVPARSDGARPTAAGPMPASLPNEEERRAPRDLPARGDGAGGGLGPANRATLGRVGLVLPVAVLDPLLGRSQKRVPLLDALLGGMVHGDLVAA